MKGNSIPNMTSTTPDRFLGDDGVRLDFWQESLGKAAEAPGITGDRESKLRP